MPNPGADARSAGPATGASLDRDPAEDRPPAEDRAEDPADAPADDLAFEPAAPAPLGLGRTATGHAGVDALLGRLADADHLPADGHLDVYEDVHRGLREELTSLDADRPGPTPSQDPNNLRS